MASDSNNDSSALFPDKGSTHDFWHEKHTKVPEGGVLGGALEWIAAIVGR